MAIPVTCTCGKEYRVRDNLANSQFRCYVCGRTFLVSDTTTRATIQQPKRNEPGSSPLSIGLPGAGVRAIKNEPLAFLVIICLALGIFLSLVGWYFFVYWAEFHVFWGLCAATLGSGAICLLVYHAGQTRVRCGRFQRQVEKTEDPSSLVNEYIGKFGLLPEEHGSNTAAILCMLFIVPICICGLYKFPWTPDPDSMAGFVRVGLVILLSLITSVVLGVAGDALPNVWRRRMRASVSSKGDEFLKQFRYCLQGMRKNSIKVGSLIQTRRSESRSQSLMWLSVTYLACAELEKLVRIVVSHNVLAGTEAGEPERAWPALASAAEKEMRDALSCLEGDAGPARILAEYIRRRAEALMEISLEEGRRMSGYRLIEYYATTYPGPLGAGLSPRIQHLADWGVIQSSITISQLDTYAAQLPRAYWLSRGLQEQDEWGAFSGIPGRIRGTQY